MFYTFRLCLAAILALSFTLTACDSSEELEGEDTNPAIGCDDVGAITIRIMPNATYLRTDSVDEAAPAQAVRLSEVGLHPGDSIRIERLGEYQFRAHIHPDSVMYDAVAVFSSNATLLERSEFTRVPGALDVGIDYVTEPTFYENLATDIPEDFGIAEAVTLTVPDGAAFIFMSPGDTLFEDNTDEDDDYRLCITHEN